jgi:hypothetical protein
LTSIAISHAGIFRGFSSIAYGVVYSHIENCQPLHEINHPAVREVMRYLELARANGHGFERRY